MKILLIILSIIGSLKLLSLFILAISQIYYNIRGKKAIELRRDSMFYPSKENFYIVPTIKIYNGSFLEITIYWLGLEYYECYKMELENESSSV